jgi:hypothetical protein
VLEAPWRLKRILLHGLEGPIDVLGNSYNGAMPAFVNRLTDEQIAAVLSYIRQSWGNDADRITPESVAATREAAMERTTPWSADELQAFSEPDYVPKPEQQQAGDQQEETVPAGASAGGEANREADGAQRE